jgi:ABC-type long-subunit fatty acid transport system fused permease/ATPase subunit
MALGMLVIVPGLIAGSVLTKSVKQVPNVVTQISFAYCGYTSHKGGDFWAV